MNPPENPIFTQETKDPTIASSPKNLDSSLPVSPTEVAKEDPTAIQQAIEDLKRTVYVSPKTEAPIANQEEKRENMSFADAENLLLSSIESGSYPETMGTGAKILGPLKFLTLGTRLGSLSKEGLRKTFEELKTNPDGTIRMKYEQYVRIVGQLADEGRQSEIPQFLEMVYRHPGDTINAKTLGLGNYGNNWVMGDGAGWDGRN
jgi:hypothetical protein